MGLVVGFDNCDERKKEMGEVLMNFSDDGDDDEMEEPYASP